MHSVKMIINIFFRISRIDFSFSLGRSWCKQYESNYTSYNGTQMIFQELIFIINFCIYWIKFLLNENTVSKNFVLDTVWLRMSFYGPCAMKTHPANQPNVVFATSVAFPYKNIKTLLKTFIFSWFHSGTLLIDILTNL